jgi:two-component system CheB/CheR fusion protein
VEATPQARGAAIAGERVPAPSPEARPGEGAPFPIVGIGASAGGLEAFEQFLRNVPERTDMAFVLLQHLDPTHKAILVELLQRACKMPVVQVQDRMRVEPGRVHVIPPKRDMSIVRGVLHLWPLATARGLPIDFFFRSLAEDRGERAIGVVLSGMGSDGTLGLGAIKEKGGATFAQSVSSAKFSAMPRSAVEAGFVDVVAPVAELPARIISYLQHASTLPREVLFEDKQHSALEKVFVILRAQTGNDFSQYKRSTICRRIERRMGLHQIDQVAGYVRFLRENPKETELLFKELLIGVTSFFRDAPAWEHLKTDVLRQLIEAREGSRVLRAWVPGCSTGEEAYSLAMVLKEALDERKHGAPLTVQVFGTDLDGDAIETARQGVYPANIAADVSAERLRRFFIQDERGYRVSKEIREVVVFAPQNIVMDPPFTKLDVLCCRNLLIYLSPELQKKLIPLFHYALSPGGILFLGSAETVGYFGSLFGPVDGKTRLYRRIDSAVMATPVEFPSSFTAAPTPLEAAAEGGAGAKGAPANLQSVADRIIVQRFAPASILTTDKGEILYIGGRTGKYLEPAVGRANLNVLAMAREGLRYELSAAFSTALREDRAVTLHGVRVGNNGGTQNVDVTVEKLSEPRDLRGTVMIVITDAPSFPEPPASERTRRVPLNARMAVLERELQHSREELQTTREEMQTSQEELKSTNEELQSTNEELQSTNEELTTSQEEMQSMNEELQTVNHELQAKVDELSRSNNDMKNLLNSTDIATLFLDGELLVRRFTTQTAKLIKLIPGDTGRPITDIATDLEYPDLSEDAREVLRTLMFKERQVAARDGRWFTVRLLPYRTLENVIDGVVITFTEVTATKRLEATLREQAGEFRQMAESLPTLVWGCRADGACDYLSPQWLQYTGVAESEGLGYGWLDQVHPDDRGRVRDEWRGMARSGAALDTEFRIRGAAGAYRWFTTRSAPIRDGRGHIARWYGISTDVDDLKRTADVRQQAADVFAAVVEGIAEPFVAVDESRTVTAWNVAAERALGHRREETIGRPLAFALSRLPAALDGEVEQALRERRAVEIGIDEGNGARRLRVRIVGHPGGAALYFGSTAAPEDEGRAAGGDGT